MALQLQAEVWASDIAPNIFPDNSFTSKSVNDSIWVSNLMVNLPQSGAVPKVVRGRTQYPAQITRRTDSNNTYNLVELTSDPTLITDVEETEVSYQKRQSVLFDHNEQLSFSAADYAIFKWCPTVSANIIATTGGTRTSLAPGTTGTRKALLRADIVKAKVAMDSANIPQKGRYMLIDAQMHADLLADTTVTSKDWSFDYNNLMDGYVGRLLGFDIFMRAFVGRMATGNTGAKDPDSANATSDNSFGLCWQESYVRRALGEIKVFANEDDATLYGSAFSALVRTGASPRYTNFRGIIALAEN
jgi:hypothetical protein